MKTIPAGRINRLFGTEGGVMLSLYEAFPADFDPEHTPLLVRIDALEVPLWCSRFERRGVAGAVAAFADLDNERRARELLGLEFRLAQEDDADADDEFRLEDLIGFSVTAEEIAAGVDSAGTIIAHTPPSDARRAPAANGTPAAEIPSAEAAPTGIPTVARRILHGTLTDFYDSDANPLFEVEFDGRTVLVPAAEEFIARIDFEHRSMHLVLPEGLLDLQ